jgi:4-hydroxybenzoate polyprenyltransferase
MKHRKSDKKLPVEVITPSDLETPQLYSGVYTAPWVSHFLVSWAPYIQLARLSPPFPFLLIYFPHLFGVTHSAATLKALLHDVLRVYFLLFEGSFFLFNAIHGWNDLIDAPIDRLNPRTRNRPVI